MATIASERTIQGIDLELTCGGCPEQYDAYLGAGQVGYLRLRHGIFTVDCPDVGGQEVFSANTVGDGNFDEDEREYYLSIAVFHIWQWIKHSKDVRAQEIKYNLTNG